MEIDYRWVPVSNRFFKLKFRCFKFNIKLYENGKYIHQPKWLQSLWKGIEEMCGHSGILSLKYFADRKRHWIERMWWFGLVAVSFCVCAYLMLRTWHWRSLHPINVVLDDKISTIDSIPFPAVTVCPGSPLWFLQDSYFLFDLNNSSHINGSQMSSHQNICTKAQHNGTQIEICERLAEFIQKCIERRVRTLL